MKKKVLSILLSLCMVLTLVPTFSIANVTAATTSVSTLSALLTALADTSTDEIIITRKIALTNGTVLSGNGKTITVRASTTGVNEQGIVQSGSNYNVFTIASGATVKIYDMTIKGGSATAVVNAGTLYLDNVTISNSGSSTHGAGGINNSGTLVMKNSSIIRNVAQYGGGFLNTGTLIMDNCSLSENRSINGWGGGAGENEGTAYINNCTIANNTSAEIGGGINNTKGGKLYLMNSTFTGNVSTVSDPNYGGAIGNNSIDAESIVKAVNCIFAYNYTINGSTITQSDIGMYNSSSNDISLYHCVYTSIQGDGTPTAVSDCSTDTTDLFAKIITGGVLYEDGSESTVEFSKPATIRNTSGELYVPISGSYAGTIQGVPTYFDYSDLSNIRMYFTDEASGSTTTTFFAGSAVEDTDLPVDSTIDDTARSTTLVGSSNALPAGTTIYTIKVEKSTNGMVTGGTIYGDGYVVFTDGESVSADQLVTVTLTAQADSGYYFKEWQYSDGTVIGSNNPYQFVVNADVDLKAVFTSTAPTYTVTYHANADSYTGTMSAQSFPSSSRTQNLESNAFVNGDGSTFLGWALVYCGDVKYADAASYTAIGSADLYARWGYTVTYNANGGRNVPEQQIKTKGTALTLSSLEPTRDGYVFLGWNTDSSATTATVQPGAAYSTDASVTLYAIWHAVSVPAFINGSGTPDYAVKNVAYTYTFETDQDAIYTSTDLPSWLTLSKLGTLTGTPTATGDYTFNVKLTNKLDKTLSTTQQVTVHVYDYCDYTALTNTVANNTVVSTDESLYTADTWAAYQTALNNANTLLTNASSGNKLVNVTDSGNQTTIDNANTALQNAIAALTYKDADYTALNNAIASAEAIDLTTVYPNADKTAFETALQNAKNESTALNITHQSEIETLTTALTDAMNALGYYANYTDLQKAVDDNTVTAADESKYTPEAWTQYQTALTAANDLLNASPRLINDAAGTNQKTIDDAKAALDAAIANLANNAYCDYTALNNAIAAAATTDTTGKTQSSIDALNAAVTAGNAVTKNMTVADLNGTAQSTINTAAQAILDAINGLTNKADYTNYNTDLASAQAIIDAGNNGKYPDDVWNTFVAAIDTAKGLDKDLPSTSQTTVDNAVTSITGAITALNNNAYCDYTALNNAIAAAATTDTTGKTQSSIDALNAAVTAGNAVTKNMTVADLNGTAQSTINTAAQAILDAINGLTNKADYTNYNTDLASAQAIIDAGNNGKYPDDVWNTFVAAIDTANGLDKDLPSTSQTTVDNAVTSITGAVTALNDGAYNTIKVYDKDGTLIKTLYLADTTGAGLNTTVTAPTVEGYSFLGWGDANGNLFTDAAAINSDMSIYAYYELTKITPKNGSAVVVDHTAETVTGLTGKTDTVDQIKAELENDEILVIIKDYKSTLLTGTDKVGTGSTITLVSKKDPTHIYEVTTVILMGDVNGDGLINDADFDKELGITIGTGTDFTNSEALFKKAGDINSDGVIDGFDMSQINLIMTSLNK